MVLAVTVGAVPGGVETGSSADRVVSSSIVADRVVVAEGVVTDGIVTDSIVLDDIASCVVTDGIVTGDIAGCVVTGSIVTDSIVTGDIAGSIVTGSVAPGDIAGGIATGSIVLGKIAGSVVTGGVVLGNVAGDGRIRVVVVCDGIRPLRRGARRAVGGAHLVGPGGAVPAAQPAASGGVGVPAVGRSGSVGHVVFPVWSERTTVGPSLVRPSDVTGSRARRGRHRRADR